jgi:myosin-5
MPGDIRGLSMEILKKTITETDKYQVGLTKVFFRPGMVRSFIS